MPDDIHLDPITRLTRDLRTGAMTLGDDEARFLVDAYYIIQDDRKRSFNQARTLEAAEEPNMVITWLADQSATLEKEIQKALDIYTTNHIMGGWMRQVFGIGPVLSAGLLAHIFMGKWCAYCRGRDEAECAARQEKDKKADPHVFTPVVSSPTVGHIWQFAGIAGEQRDDAMRHACYRVKFKSLDPNSPPELRLANGEIAIPYYPDRENCYIYQYRCGVNDAPEAELPRSAESCAVSLHSSGQRAWEKGQKRPYNTKLKTLCWKIGQSFMKLSNDPKCFYGKLYRDRKAQEIARNEAGEFAAQAAIWATRVGKATEAYKYYSIGKLSPGHIDARARRYAVKIFLSHLHEEWFRRSFKSEPPRPFAISILNHAHYIASPH